MQIVCVQSVQNQFGLLAISGGFGNRGKTVGISRHELWLCVASPSPDRTDDIYWEMLEHALVGKHSLTWFLCGFIFTASNSKAWLQAKHMLSLRPSMSKRPFSQAGL